MRTLGAMFCVLIFAVLMTAAARAATVSDGPNMSFSGGDSSSGVDRFASHDRKMLGRVSSQNQHGRQLNSSDLTAELPVASAAGRDPWAGLHRAAVGPISDVREMPESGRSRRGHRNLKLPVPFRSNRGAVVGNG